MSRTQPPPQAVPRREAPEGAIGATPGAAADDAPTPPYARRWAALVVLCLALGVIGMDSMIVNVTLPTLARALQASGSQLQWIVDAYILVSATALLSMGSLGDRFGRRGALYAGLLIFLAGSVASAFAGSAELLIASRAVMGLGGALICPATLSIVTNIFPKDELGKAIGIWASFAGIGIVLGPPIGGWLLGHFWWGSVFLVNVPIVAVLLPAIWLLVPTSRDPHATPLDPVGALLSAAGLAALVFAIIEVPVHGWTAPRTLAGFALAAVLIPVFLRWEVRARYPMLPLPLFANPRFSAANGALTLMFFALNGAVFALTQYLQSVLGFSPLRAGVAILPVASLVITAPLSAGLVRRAGTKVAVVLGMLMQATAAVLLTRVSATSGYPLIAVALGLFGLGLGLAMAPATEAIMGALPAAKAGVGSAMNDTVRGVGGALGVAVLGSVLSAVYASTVHPATAGLPEPVAAGVRSSIEAANQLAATLGPRGVELAAAARSAFVDAMSAAALVAVAALTAGALLAALFLPARPHEPDGTGGGGRRPGRIRRPRPRTPASAA